MTMEVYKVSITYERMTISDHEIKEWLPYEDSCTTIAEDDTSANDDARELWEQTMLKHGVLKYCANINTHAKLITDDITIPWVS